MPSPYRQPISITLDGAGKGSFFTSNVPRSWTYVTVSARASSSVNWAIGIGPPSSQVITQVDSAAGIAVRSGPYLLAPGETVILAITGGIANDLVTGSVFGIQDVDPAQVFASPIITSVLPSSALSIFGTPTTDLIIPNGNTVTLAVNGLTFFHYNKVDVQTGGTLNFSGSGMAVITAITSMNIDGTINGPIAAGSTLGGNIQAVLPINAPTLASYAVPPGGGGGGGGSGSNAGVTVYGGAGGGGGASIVANVGKGGPGNAPGANGGAPAGGVGGAGNVGDTGGHGGTGAITTSSTVAATVGLIASGAAGESDDPLATGGLGDAKGGDGSKNSNNGSPGGGGGGGGGGWWGGGGGGGGGGNATGAKYAGGIGGNGTGNIVLISRSNVTGAGTINTNGGNGFQNANGADAQGGSGAGGGAGSISVLAGTSISNLTATANGGLAATGVSTFNGGNGGPSTITSLSNLGFT